ncbi:MAG: Sensor histidine kinase RcsC [Syntrophus sp. SKADARSKE-3]|nr:Sensor histidine kinase RcsC [Syntrophus sp. SKADARSKE-3]
MKTQGNSGLTEPTILIIDDEPNNLAVMSGFLEDSSFTILVAEDFEMGLERAHNARPDLILLDILMPQMDGYEVCRQLKAMESTKDIPVIFMTALAETEHKVKGFAVGAVDYITKPFQREEVLARVGVHLHIRELTTRLREEKELLEQRVEERTEELARANKELQEEVVEHKKTEKALQESQRRLSNIIEFLPDATLVINNEGQVIAWNKAIENMTGVQSEEILNKGNYEYALPFYGERRPLLIDLVLEPNDEVQEKYTSTKWQESTLVGEEFIPDFRGNPVYHLGTASPLYDTKGAIAGAIETIKDVTDQKKMEAALASEHDRLAAILDGIPIPSFMTDLNNTIVLWNRNSEIITGKAKSEMLGQKLDLSLFFKDKAPPPLAKLILEMTDKELMRKFGSRGLSKSDVFPGAFESVGRIMLNGEEHIMLIQAARIYNHRKEVIGAVQTAQDITERIRVQKEQEKLRSQLIHAQKMEAIGTLAGGIAHDFNNILAVIIGFSEMAVRHLPNVDITKSDLDKVLQASNRAKELVVHLLTLSRRAEVAYSPIAIESVIKETLKMLRAVIPTTIEIRMNLMSSGRVMSNYTQIHQVLMNICINATHAMDEKGGGLEIRLDKENILDNAAARDLDLTAGPYMRISISDTGQGMTPEVMERIFDPYFTTKEMGQGTGLGLAVVSGIVKNHKGAIVCKSRLGVGTTFDIYLPELESDAATAKPSAEKLLPGGTEDILIVDDDPLLVSMLKTMLEDLGYRVTAETSSIAALEIFKKAPDQFDLVITDMTMPVMTGDRLAQRLMDLRRDIPIILCTGYSERISKDLAGQLGIREFVMKPVNTSALAEIIRQVLESDKSNTERA